MPIHQKNICIVEDDRDVRDSLHAVVSTLGYTCNTFASAEVLLANRGDYRCDFMIIDFHLPEMTGTDLLKQLRATGDHTPAVLYSGRVDEGIISAAQAIGDVPVIQKGNNVDEIINQIQMRLGKNES